MGEKFTIRGGGVGERVEEGDSHGLEISSQYINGFSGRELSEKDKKSIEGSIALVVSPSLL